MTIEKVLKEVEYLKSRKNDIYIRRDENEIKYLSEDLKASISYYKLAVSRNITSKLGLLKTEVLRHVVHIHRRNLSMNFRDLWQNVT